MARPDTTLAAATEYNSHAPNLICGIGGQKRLASQQSKKHSGNGSGQRQRQPQIATQHTLVASTRANQHRPATKIHQIHTKSLPARSRRPGASHTTPKSLRGPISGLKSSLFPFPALVLHYAFYLSCSEKQTLPCVRIAGKVWSRAGGKGPPNKHETSDESGGNLNMASRKLRYYQK